MVAKGPHEAATFTGTEVALPVLRQAVVILRELARGLEPRLLFDKPVVEKIDMMANQIETLADHLEHAA